MTRRTRTASAVALAVAFVLWGHPNGTATWSQSSDSIDECFPFHTEKVSGYGPFPGF